MRKSGILILIIGVLELILFFVGLLQDTYKPPLLIVIALLGAGYGLIKLGAYQKKKALESETPYKEISWGRVILYIFIGLFVFGLIGKIASKSMEDSFEGQIRKANNNCPINVSGGVAVITKIYSADNHVVYKVEMDIQNVPIDIIKLHPDIYKRAFIISSNLLNGQNGHGDGFMDMLISNNYGIRFNIETNTGEKFSVSASNQELKEMRYMIQQSPTEAFKELLEWQIKIGESDLPMKIGENMTLVENIHNNNSLIYRVLLDNSVSLSDFKNYNTKETRMEILNELYSDPLSKSNLDLCAVGKFNMIYRYISHEYRDSVDMIFSHEEIYQTVNLPNQLNLR